MYRGGLIGQGEKWRHLPARSGSACRGISLEPIRKLAETPLRGSFVRLPDRKLSGLFRPDENRQGREKPEVSRAPTTRVPDARDFSARPRNFLRQSVKSSARISRLQLQLLSPFLAGTYGQVSCIGSGEKKLPGH